VLTQALSTDAALGLKLESSLWRRAVASAELDLDGSPREVAWTHGSLLELYLLRLLVEEADPITADYPLISIEEAKKQALKSAEKNAAGGRLDPLVVESTRRQIERYEKWWRHVEWQAQLESVGRRQNPEAWANVDALVVKILEKLPKTQ